MAGDDEFREDLYEILGLEPAADERQVARAYKKKSILHHPDRGGDGTRRQSLRSRGQRKSV